MNKLSLTLRQRKLLHHMMNQKGFVTGGELARELGVTDRTIRSDVLEINRNILPWHAEIQAERSKGYYFVAEDDQKIHELNQIELGLLTKEERVRYMAFRLCLSKEPIHLLDLEEEMYASYTTLEQDLKVLQQKYVTSSPFIKLKQKNNELSFEQDERKIRTILTRLVHDDWNYNKGGNAYYGYHFLDEQVLSHIMNTVPVCLHKYGIFMEDPALVYLDIMLAVAYQRFEEGYVLVGSEDKRNAPVESISENATDGEDMLPSASSSAAVQDRENARRACSDIFNEIEQHYNCVFPEVEKHEIYTQIVMSELPDVTEVSVENVASVVSEEVLNITDEYLKRIHSVFGIDLSVDDDFYATLSLTISTFQNEAYIYNTQGNPSIAKNRLLDEVEMAWLFQELAKERIGRFLSEIELINLAHCIGGALIWLFQSHPELKLRTVICTHRNMMSLWYMKRKLISEFDTYLDVTGLIPVNSHINYDFSSTDLVLTTDNRPITDNPGTETLFINYFVTDKDASEIAAYIKRKRFERLYPVKPNIHMDLLKKAAWHEKEERMSKEQIIRILADDFKDDALLDGRLARDIIQRENITSFVTGRGIAFLHTMMPAQKTQLSVMTLDHRVIWNGYKVRMVILGVFAEKELPILFYLKHLFYDGDREAMRMLKTREEICDFFENP